MLYLLEWDNGEQYADKEVTLLGIYTTAARREEAKERFVTLFDYQWPFTGGGQFVDSEFEANEDIVKPHANAPTTAGRSVPVKEQKPCPFCGGTGDVRDRIADA